MKKIILCMVVLTALLCVTGYAYAEFSNAKLETSIVDGSIVVSGSFDAA